MNFEERTNAIGTLLREHILPRYKRPEHLDDATARAELADMVGDLNRAWPVMGVNRFGDVADGLCRAIRTTHTSRTWPTIAALVKALNVALEPPKVATPDEDAKRDDAIYAMVLEWWLRFKDAMPSTATEAHAVRLQRDGHATWGQLRRGGFRLPPHGREAAMVEPDPNHPAIMEDIRRLGEQIANNGFGAKGSLAGAKPPQHWAKDAAPDDPRFAELRRARAAAGVEVPA